MIGAVDLVAMGRVTNVRSLRPGTRNPTRPNSPTVVTVASAAAPRARTGGVRARTIKSASATLATVTTTVRGLLPAGLVDPNPCHAAASAAGRSRSACPGRSRAVISARGDRTP